jgi:hypothetical protein
MYRWLLRLYPASFRNEYGREMATVFARERRDTRTALGMAALWLRVIADTCVNAAGIHGDILEQDLRYTLRTLRRTPAFALTAVTVVALGIGATTAAFSLADFVLIRPLPFPEADRLVRVSEERPGLPRMELAPANYRDLKQMAASFETLGAYRGLSVNLVGARQPLRLQGAAMTADVLAALAVRPMIGRPFTAADDVDGAPASVATIVSSRTQRTTDGDPWFAPDLSDTPPQASPVPGFTAVLRLGLRGRRQNPVQAQIGGCRRVMVGPVECDRHERVRARHAGLAAEHGRFLTQSGIPEFRDACRAVVERLLDRRHERILRVVARNLLELFWAHRWGRLGEGGAYRHVRLDDVSHQGTEGHLPGCRLITVLLGRHQFSGRNQALGVFREDVSYRISDRVHRRRERFRNLRSGSSRKQQDHHHTARGRHADPILRTLSEPHVTISVVITIS